MRIETTFKHFSEKEAFELFQKVLKEAKRARMIDFHYHAEVDSLPYAEWSVKKLLIEDMRNEQKSSDK